MGGLAAVNQDTAYRPVGVSYQEYPDDGGDCDYDFVVIQDGRIVGVADTEEEARELALAMATYGDGLHLLIHVQRGDIEAAKAELERNPAAIDMKGVFGATPLFMAAEAGDEAMVGLLIEFGADIDARDEADNTPLIIAAWKCHAGVVRVLAAAGAGLELVDDEDATALTLAAHHDQPEVIEALIQAGANLEHEAGGLTALEIASKEGNAGVVESLLEAGADPYHVAVIHMNAVKFAGQNDHLDIVNLLYLAMSKV